MKLLSGHTIAAMVAALALAFPVLAGSPEAGRPPGGNAKRPDTQQKMKDDAVKHIDDKIRILQEAKSCVRAAMDMKAMADCYAQERKKTKALREQARSRILERKAQRDE